MPFTMGAGRGRRRYAAAAHRRIVGRHRKDGQPDARPTRASDRSYPTMVGRAPPPRQPPPCAHADRREGHPGQHEGRRLRRAGRLHRIADLDRGRDFTGEGGLRGVLRDEAEGDRVEASRDREGLLVAADEAAGEVDQRHRHRPVQEALKNKGVRGLGLVVGDGERDGVWCVVEEVGGALLGAQGRGAGHDDHRGDGRGARTASGRQAGKFEAGHGVQAAGVGGNGEGIALPGVRPIHVAGATRRRPTARERRRLLADGWSGRT